MRKLEMSSDALFELTKANPSKEWRPYETKAVYTDEDLPLDFLKWHAENDHSLQLEDVEVAVSQNLLLFTTTSQTCPTCGLEGSFWALQRSGNRPFHLNLWGLDEELKPRLFTKDHVVPRSKGGPDEMSNYRTMCMRCNNKRGNKED